MSVMQVLASVTFGEAVSILLLLIVALRARS